MPHGGSSHKIVTFSSGMLRECQRRRRLNPYVCIHRGHEEEIGINSCVRNVAIIGKVVGYINHDMMETP